MAGSSSEGGWAGLAFMPGQPSTVAAARAFPSLNARAALHSGRRTGLPQVTLGHSMDDEPLCPGSAWTLWGGLPAFTMCAVLCAS
eukprot:8195170-Pyramimonas_sp.AAC.1